MKARITDLLSARHAMKDAINFLGNAYYPAPAPEALIADLNAALAKVTDVVNVERKRRDEKHGKAAAS
jgi:hypothetical protein